MKKHELISLLSKYDDDCEIKCLIEDSYWWFDGESSIEVGTVEECKLIEEYINQRSDGSILIGKKYD